MVVQEDMKETQVVEDRQLAAELDMIQVEQDTTQMLRGLRMVEVEHIQLGNLD
jgi:hypothetical protein